MTKTLRDYQATAIADGLATFTEHDRAHFVLACGAGKTLISLRLQEAVNPGTVLALFPTLALLQQTYDEWSADAEAPFDAYAFCSRTRGAGSDDLDSSQLHLPHTTDVKVVAGFLAAPSSKPKILFATYQSSPKLAALHTDHGVGAWDLAIFDEAHRTAGRAGKKFSAALHDHTIPVHKRAFFTATPVTFTSRNSPDGENIPAHSMDDLTVYGPRVCTVHFSYLQERGYLSDYQVAVMVLTNKDVADMIKDNPDIASYQTVTRRGSHGRTETVNMGARDVAVAAALSKAIRQADLRSIAAFHSSIAKSQGFAMMLPSILGELAPEERPLGWVTADAVWGTQDAAERDEIIHRLSVDPATTDIQVVSNARILSEGVNIPSLDAILFADAKSSKVDITQQVGRALRLNENRDAPSLVIIPIIVPAEGYNPEDDGFNDDDLATGNYDTVVNVLGSLADNDPQFQARLNAERDVTLATETPDAEGMVGSDSYRSDIDADGKWLDGKLVFINQTGENKIQFRRIINSVSVDVLKESSDLWDWWGNFYALKALMEEERSAAAEAA
ncbi:DEAD/DEAH box helicase family protein [Paeniglutamicibacter antarcticus]|uniref:DEAD/DEAH box helicase family protein n=1 Tax=Arthrobacter terrae TaxID=2935737 RepID=A0A931CQ58_9MICC|nr:DEAD/DEAH box helicase family protein [Arthrobacter terrae]MBG0738976.1 DEAD/DEAH box helicase family protein [Arthrobacter terrae]